MRTISLNIYKYDELPTEEAKEKARNWWYDREMEDPAWRDEHFQSRNAALLAISKHLKPKELIEQSESCVWTGYCADSLLADFIKQYKKIPEESELSQYYQTAWNEEFLSRGEVDYIEEIIESNEYEFLEDGSFYC